MSCRVRLMNGWASRRGWIRPLGVALFSLPLIAANLKAADPLEALQAQSAADRDVKRERVYHFGSQGPDDVFSNHASHTNRLVPVYVFGRKVDLKAIMGENSAYRDTTRLARLYGQVPEHTLNPTADYGDQADLHQVQRDAVARGVKHLFIVWFDGMDWDTTRAAAIARSGQVYDEGKGTGLAFQAETAEGSAQYGFVVCSPAHGDPRGEQVDVDRQTVAALDDLVRGGYDPRLAGPTPWTAGPLQALSRGYLKGQSADAAERAAIAGAGGVVHAYTDSASSGTEFASGVKTYNDAINVGPDGRFTTTVFHDLQRQGWKVGTVTSVPFNHASPAAFYARNVSRNDFQDLARDMLGLRWVGVQAGRGPALPGLDVVLGCGWGATAADRALRNQGSNAVAGNPYITDADKAAIQDERGGPYVVVERTAGQAGATLLRDAAARAAREKKRLFGLFGLPVSGHLPYQTADGDYTPVKGGTGVAETYSPADLSENPTLADMTTAALEVLAADGKPFALFVEAGDVDFALHDNNLDNAVGAVYSGEEAFQVIVDWIQRHSNWDDAAVIVTADHGHYLVVDRPEELAGSAR